MGKFGDGHRGLLEGVLCLLRIFLEIIICVVTFNYNIQSVVLHHLILRRLELYESVDL